MNKGNRLWSATTEALDQVYAYERDFTVWMSGGCLRRVRGGRWRRALICWAAALFVVVLAQLVLHAGVSAATLDVLTNGADFDLSTAATGNVRVAGMVLCSAPDGAGGVFVGGSFVQVNGVARSNLAHIRADGSVDPWTPDPNSVVTGLYRSDSTLYVGGVFSTIAGGARARMAAFRTLSMELLPWAPSTNGQVAAMARIGDRLFLGGAFSSLNGSYALNFGAVDATTGTRLPLQLLESSQVYAMAVRDTELFVGGEGFLVARKPTTGALSRSLPGLGFMGAWVGALAVADDILYVGGQFDCLGSERRECLGAIDLASGVVTAWNPGSVRVRGMAAEGDHLFVTGSFGMTGGANRSGIARISRTTARADGWIPATTPTSECLTVSVMAGAVFVGGTVRIASPPPAPATRLPLSGFPQVNGPVFATCRIGDTLYVGGAFTRIGLGSAQDTPWAERTNTAAFRWSTGELLDWGVAFDGTVTELAPYGDKLVAGGQFRAVRQGFQTYPAKGVALIDRGTAEPTPWNTGLDGPVTALAVWGDTLYLGGDFNNATSCPGCPVDSQSAAIPRPRACAFDLRTRALTSWNPAPFGRIEDLVRVGDRVFLGGDLTSVQGVPRGNLAAVDAFEGALADWNPGAGGPVHDLLLGEGTLFIGGRFSVAGGAARGGGAAFSLETGALLPWNPEADHAIHCMSALGAGVLVGGEFASLGAVQEVRLGWVDPIQGKVLERVGFTPADAVYALSEKDGRITVGGAFPEVAGIPDHAWFAAISSPDVGTATVLSLVDAHAEPTCVVLRATYDRLPGVRLERRTGPQGEWHVLDCLPAREDPWLVFVDSTVQPGATYHYRLLVPAPDGVVRSGELVVTTPAELRFRVGPVHPNPSRGEFTVQWANSAPGPVWLELLDAGGRRVLAAHVEAPQPGTHVWQPREAAHLPAGVYWVRARSAQGESAQRFSLIR